MAQKVDTKGSVRNTTETGSPSPRGCVGHIVVPASGGSEATFALGRWGTATSAGGVQAKTRSRKPMARGMCDVPSLSCVRVACKLVVVVSAGRSLLAPTELGLGGHVRTCT